MSPPINKRIKNQLDYIRLISNYRLRELNLRDKEKKNKAQTKIKIQSENKN